MNMAYLNHDRQREIDNAIQDIKLRTGFSYPENSLLDIIKAFGIEVYEIDLSDVPKVKGVVRYLDKDGKPDPTIFISKSLPKEGKTFTLAHELGHYFLHPQKNKLRVDFFDYSQNTTESIEETEANYFAGSLLVPKEKLQRAMSVTRDIKVIAKFFGVSVTVIETRIEWIRKNKT